MTQGSSQTAGLDRPAAFYRTLLELGHSGDLQALVEDALRLIVEVTGGERGYLRVVGDPSRDLAASHGLPSRHEVSAVRAAMSEGILSEALVTGEVVQTQSALLDARFANRESVKEHRIEAVICAPIGAFPPLAALYVQRPNGAGPFSAEDLQLVCDFCRHTEPVLRRLLARDLERQGEDRTRGWRERLRLEGFAGTSPALARVFQQVSMVAPLEIGVLLTGPSGSGKTALARAIHGNGPRREGPFVELNCAALPESLVESELFGAAAGAHSTATKPSRGKVAAAHGGTLFLDEVAELSAAAQAKLLQLLESWTYYPLGASQPVEVDVRLIAATNQDLAERVRERRFREDLYYRLNPIEIRVPSLTERREDVLPLAERFLLDASRRHGIPRRDLAQAARRALLAADWPGNVRQLANAVEGGLVRAAGSGAPCVELEHLFPDGAAAPGEGADGVVADPSLGFQEATRRFQRRLILEALAETGGNKKEAAQRLGISRSHLYNLMREHALQPDGPD